jgi:hypothetical protein
MTAKKKKSMVGKTLLGATVVATAAGVAALAANKKVRTKVAAGAKSALKRAGKDPRVRQAEKQAGTLVSKVGKAIGDWLK